MSVSFQILFYVPELKEKNGNDADVVAYIEQSPVTQTFLRKLYDLIEFLLPEYTKEGKSQLMIGVGCTGGHHRSVFVANALGRFIESCGYQAQVIHRDLLKK